MQKPIYTASVTRTTLNETTKKNVVTVLLQPTSFEANNPQEVKAALITRMSQDADLNKELTNPGDIEFNISTNPTLFFSAPIGA